MAALTAAAPFQDPYVTAKGEERAWVGLDRLEVLWFALGTRCNLSCPRCYIESSPQNDRLEWLTAGEVESFLEQAPPTTRTIGFTGGEPFVNRAFQDILAATLRRGFEVLVLTNATTPLHNARRWLPELAAACPGKLTLRVSLDHYTAERHDAERGAGMFAKTLEGLVWLAGAGFPLQVAGRSFWDETDAALRAGFAALFAAHRIPVDAADPGRLVIFPEMDEAAPVPEITTRCWEILGKAPSSVMCATSRMVVRRKGAARPVVLPCTLLPYDERFELGETLAEADRPVPLNHPHCAKFCVLGGASCGG